MIFYSFHILKEKPLKNIKEREDCNSLCLGSYKMLYRKVTFESIR